MQHKHLVSLCTTLALLACSNASLAVPQDAPALSDEEMSDMRIVYRGKSSDIAMQSEIFETRSISVVCSPIDVLFDIRERRSGNEKFETTVTLSVNGEEAKETHNKTLTRLFNQHDDLFVTADCVKTGIDTNLRLKPSKKIVAQVQFDAASKSIAIELF